MGWERRRKGPRIALSTASVQLGLLEPINTWLKDPKDLGILSTLSKRDMFGGIVHSRLTLLPEGTLRREEICVDCQWHGITALAKYNFLKEDSNESFCVPLVMALP